MWRGTPERLQLGDRMKIVIPADLPPALERLVMRALDPDPARRPRDAEELRRQLANVADSCGDEMVTEVDQVALAATAAV